MSVDANQLLRSLGSGIRPGGPDALTRPTSTAVDVAGGSFSELLQAVSSGQLSSGAPVTVAKSANLNLSPKQMSRLTAAADRAQAEGADRAVVLIDGMALSLDVATRTITGTVKAAAGGKIPQVLTGVDTVITVPSEDEAAGPVQPLAKLSTGGLNNPSLLNALAKSASFDPSRHDSPESSAA